MARIAEAELERLKTEVSVQRLAEVRGVELKKHGADLIGRCPFHADKTPSLVISPAKNLWHCLGACQAGGTVIDWVMKAEGVSFLHAVELLRADAPLSGAPAPSVRKLPAPVALGADDEAVLQQVVDYYHQRLKQTPDALEYLKSRGLDSAEAIAHFKLGFADRTLGLRLPHANRQLGAELRGRLQQLGIIRESGHEHFNGSLVVPILDAAGKVRGLYGRKVTPNLRPGTPLHLYLPGPHRGVFNEVGLVGQRAVIVCEAVFDALSFWCSGFRHVTAAYGVEGFTPLHLEALKRHGVREVLIAYDRDDAGGLAADALAQRLFAEGFECWRVLFPRGMDANEYACKVLPASRSLGVALRQAAWMGRDGKARPAPELQSGGAPLLAAASVTAAAQPPAITALEALKGEEAPTVEVSAAAAVESTAAPLLALVTAAAVASAPPTAVEVTASAGDTDELVFQLESRRYRVRGLKKNTSHDCLKLNILVSVGERFHVDTVELYSARQRVAFLKAAAAELQLNEEVLKRDVGLLLLKLEALQDEAMKALLAPKTPTVSEADAAAALELLKSPRLLERILEDFHRCGVVGEETNKLVGYLAAVSRKLDEPLAILIQSSSAAGKSSLMEAVLAFVPEEDKTKYSAMTGQSLFYMGDADLKHKVLAIVEEEGAARATYALKLLQSEGELTIASTGKDPTSGKLVTHEYRVEGPTQLFLTTTASELDDELLNRCLVLTVDEERPQTQAIHRLQREKQTLEGLLARRDKDAVLKVHQNAQRLLRPLMVANPYARQLTFLDDRTRTRRDFPKYLTLIRTIALLHQHQRPLRTVQHGDATLEYVEVTLADVEIANRLAAAVLGRSLDELPPQTRRLLHQVELWVGRECAAKQLKKEGFRFTRRQLRETVSMGNSQLALHLQRLVDFEYLAAARGERGGLAYELRYDGEGKDGGAFLPGLVDVATLRAHGYDAQLPGVTAQFPASTSQLPGSFRPPSGPLPVAVSSESTNGFHSLAADGTAAAANAHLDLRNGAASYVYPRVGRR